MTATGTDPLTTGPGRAADPPAPRAEPRLRPGPWLAVAAPALVVVLLLTSWEIAARTGAVSVLFFPPPSRIAVRLVELLRDGELLEDVAVTLGRLARGLVVGGLLGVAVGLVAGSSERARLVADPLVAMVHPVPKIALLPLFMVIFGIGDTSKVVVIAFAAFFPLVINAMTGVRAISPVHFEVATNFGASRALVLRRVVVPGSMPFVMAGARLSLNAALVVTVAVELVSASRGLGATIWFSWQTLRTADLYATLVVLAVLGVAANLVLQLFERRLAPWNRGGAA